MLLKSQFETQSRLSSRKVETHWLAYFCQLPGLHGWTQWLGYSCWLPGQHWQNPLTGLLLRASGAASAGNCNQKWKPGIEPRGEVSFLTGWCLLTAKLNSHTLALPKDRSWQCILIITYWDANNKKHNSKWLTVRKNLISSLSPFKEKKI